MAFSRKAGTASVAKLSGSTRIKRHPCRSRHLVQKFASEIQEQQHNATDNDTQHSHGQKRSFCLHSSMEEFLQLLPTSFTLPKSVFGITVI